MIKPIQILNDLIESTLHRVTIKSITDNLDGTYTLSVNNTYYLTLNSVVTINLVEYKITDFTLNNSITLSGAVIPTVEFFDIDSPRFVHGTPKRVNSEYTNQNINQYPFIWLLEFLDADYDDTFDGAVKAVLDLNLFFLTNSDFTDWDIDANYSYAIDPMSNEISFFIQTLKAREDLFGELSTHTVTNHVDFGTYITDKGYDKQIITDQLSGCQLRISLPYVVDVCIGDLPIVSKCFPVSIYKNMVFEKFVPSGGRFDYADGGTCLDATSIIKDSLGSILYTNSIASGATNEQTISDSTITNSDLSYNDTIEAQGSLILSDVVNIDSDGVNIPTPAQTPFVSTLCPTLIDGVVVTKDSLGAVLYNTPVANNSTVDQVINDSTITNSNATFNDAVEAEGSLVLPDIVHTQTDGAPTPLPAQTPLVCTPASDATQVIKDSDNTILYTNNIASGTSEDQIITDSTITNSDVSYNEVVKAQGSLVLPDVVNVNSDGTPTPTPAQTPFVCTPASTPVNSAPILRTGQTVSHYSNDDGATQRGRNTDWDTLEYNNSFGNTNRFTDVLGTQVYSNNVVIDWTTFDQISNKVTAYKRTLETATTGNNSVLMAPYTHATFIDWYPTNGREFLNICQIGVFIMGDICEWLNYAPFNLPYAPMWAGSAGNRSARMMVYVNTGFVSNNVTAVVPFMITRTYTLAELGL